MKTSILLLFTLLISGITFAQKRIQIKDQSFEMHAIREGKPVKVETKNFGMLLNYDTGEIFAKIDISEARLISDDEVEYRIPGDEIIEIQGFIPIKDIIYNQTVQRQYIHELNVKHLSTNVSVVFTFDATYLKNSNSGFTVFRVNGKINLLDFDAEDLKGYDPEVGLMLGFQAYMIGN